MDYENMVFCQSCCMPLVNDEDFGTNADGSKNDEYCNYCYKDGKYTTDGTMEQMIEACVPHVSKGEPWPNEETARVEMNQIFPTLKRWKK